MNTAQFTRMVNLSKRVDPELFTIFAEAISIPENPLVTMRKDTLKNDLYDTVIPVSGGLDSTAAWLMCKDRSAKCIYFDFGQTYAKQEQAVLKKLDIKHETIVVNFPNIAWEHVLPGRNMLILLRCSEYTNDNGQILFAVTNGEHPHKGGDKSRKFVVGMQNYIGRGVVIQTLRGYTKSDLIRCYKDDFRPELFTTLSCFNPTTQGLHCGKCQACLRHYIAFENNGLGDQLLRERYAANPMLQEGNPHIVKYREAMEKELATPGSTKYGYDRSIETLSVIGKDILAAFGEQWWSERQK